MNLQEIRQKYPAYQDLSDQELADALYSKYYSDIPREEYDAKIGIQAPQTPVEKGWFDQSLEEAQAGQQKAADLYTAGEQTLPETLLQGAATGADIINTASGKALSAITPDIIEEPIKRGAASAISYLADTPVGDAARFIGNQYGEFAQDNPRAARNLSALGRIGSVVAPFARIGGKSVAGSALAPVEKGAVKVGKMGGQGAIESVMGLARLADLAADKTAAGISRSMNRSGVPTALKSLSDPELLFLKTLSNEGITPQSALSSLESARGFGAIPSVSVTSNIPQMQTQAYLMSKGSAGSRVAAEAIKDIDTKQIPDLNKRIIEFASGGTNLGAEEYGKIVGTEAKSLVDRKIKQLQTRAKPFYKASVGVDKSVPISNAAMQKVLSNPLAVKALEDSRTDAFTLANTQRDLASLGVDMGDITTLPYNATVSLHAARTQLRQMADSAFTAGEKNKGAAIKTALNDIDAAIESEFPAYSTARRIYSEDSGALRTLKDSPVGKMAEFADGDYSKIANGLMSKDAGYIKKFVGNLNNQKMQDALAGAFLRRQMEEAGYDARRFSDKVFRSQGSSERLKALVGEGRYNQMKKIDLVLDDLLKTRTIPAQSITAAAQSIKTGVDIPTDKRGLIDSVRKKVAPSLFEMVQTNPSDAARYNELLFTKEGYNFLSEISKKTKTPNQKERKAIEEYLRKQMAGRK